MSDWVASIMLTCPENQYLADDGVGHVYCATCPQAYVIIDSNNNTNICNYDRPYEIPSDSHEYITAFGGKSTVPLISAGGRVAQCSCPEEYINYYARGTGAAVAQQDTETGIWSCPYPNATGLSDNVKAGDLLCIDPNYNTSTSSSSSSANTGH